MSDLNELLPVCRRKSRPGTKIFWVLVGLATIGITACLVFIRPEYRATTLVVVDDSASHVPMSLEQPILPLEQMERRVADHMIMFGSDNFISEALKSFDVMQTRWYQDGKARARGDVGQLVDAMKKRLQVRPIAHANSFEVSFRAEEPTDAARIVNAVVSRSLAQVAAMNQVRLRRQWEAYRSQTAEKLNQLRSRRDFRKQFVATQFRSPGVSLDLHVPAETFRALSDKVASLEMEKLQRKARYENLKCMEPESLRALPEVLQVAGSDSRVPWLRQEIVARQIDLSAAGAEDSENAPQVKVLRSRLRALQEKLSEVVAEVVQRESDRLIKSTETEYLSAVQAELQMRERLETAEAVVQDVEAKMGEYEAIKHEVDLLEEEYERLSAFTNQLGVLQSMADTSGGRQIGLAQPPTNRNYHRPVMAAGAIGAVPLVYGVLLILVRALRAVVKKI